MKTTHVMAFLLMITTFTASAQKSTVLDAFSKHGIDAGMLNADNLQQPTDYAFDLKQTTITAAKQTVIMAKFDPKSPKDEQWTVVSVDGKAPSKSDVNGFRKNQNKQAASNQADEGSYKVEKETPDHLVVSFKQDPGTISKDAAFLKDCRLYMTINLKTKKLEQVQAVNEKPVKINILNADKLELVTKYIKIDQGQRYFPMHQELNISAKFMGQAVNVQTITEYANYTKK
jgi:uncharacterized protein YjhX (UPF0386 family)